MPRELSAGDVVKRSGVYRVIHQGHVGAAEATCVAGARLPSCRRCGDRVCFVLVCAAGHITTLDDFR